MLRQEPLADIPLPSIQAVEQESSSQLCSPPRSTAYSTPPPPVLSPAEHIVVRVHPTENVTPPPPPPLCPPPPPPPPPPPEKVVSTEQDSSQKVRLEYRQRVDTVKFYMAEMYPDYNWEEKKREMVATLSMDLKESEPIISLPASEVVSKLFEQSMADVKGEKGSSRGKNSQVAPMEFKTVPPRFKPKLDKYYKIADCPWNVSAAAKPNCMTSSIYMSSHTSDKDRLNDFPVIKLKDKQFKELECSGRDQLPILNYTDWFVATSKMMLEKSMEALNKDDVQISDLEEIWNDLGEVLELLDSVGRCVSDLYRINVDFITHMVLFRRDAWLDRLSPQIDINIKYDMRMDDPNLSTVFSEVMVDKAKKNLKEEKLEKVQDTVLASQANVSKPQTRSLTQKGQNAGRGKGGFQAKDRSDRSGKTFQNDFQSKSTGSAKPKYSVRPPKGARGGRGGGAGFGRK